MRRLQLLFVVSLWWLSQEAVIAARSYQEVITEDGSYYTMSLYQDNAEGMFDRHYVNMTGKSSREKTTSINRFL